MNANTAFTTLVVWLGTCVPALAAGAERVDHSGLLVWAFLGLCALIVVAQVFPALLLLVGLVKGLVTKRAHEEVTTR